MAQPPIDLYIYLLRRDKKGVRILSRMKSKYLGPIKIDDIAALNLPSNLAENLERLIHESRMMWVPWAETAKSYEELRGSLSRRGYINIPVNNQPEVRIYGSTLPVANVSKLSQPSVMLQNAHPTRP